MRSPEERAQTERLEETYRRSQTAVMRRIERSVCGCDYGGNSWTTLDQARQIATWLGLQPGLRLLDLGAGAGWPGLYLRKETGCELVLSDLPVTGLRIAAGRAEADGGSGPVALAVADAAALPFPDASFEAINHSDLLCCLLEKRAVLESCRRVLRDDGRMSFSVISIAPDLATADRRRAVENGPEFIESEADYPSLLTETGWSIVECLDVTEAYADSCRRQLEADEANEEDLLALIGRVELEGRCTEWRSKLDVLAAGLLRRELFLAVPG